MKFSNLLAVGYCATLVWLAARPWTPAVQGPLPSYTSIGAWSMYYVDIKESVELYYVREDGDDTRVELDWRRFFYHSTFVSAAHPNFQKPMGERFLSFADLVSPELAALRDGEVAYTLVLSIDLIVENETIETHSFEQSWRP